MRLFRATSPLRKSLYLLPDGQGWGDLNLKKTISLPQTTFPARATGGQLQQYRERCADDLYQWQRHARPATVPAGKDEASNEFVLHDGPPYANGAVHIGHALNKILKDLIVRWELSKGKRVHYRPGWDCHGLPIELKALQQARTHTDQKTSLEDKPGQEAAAARGVGMSAVEIRAKARQLASETIGTQRRAFREWGVMGEWDKPYTTMDKEFEMKQLAVFGSMAVKGLISRKHRPVYWSPSSQTALAEAELEYDDAHKCTAAFVKMPFISLPKIFSNNSAVEYGRVSALIWTTTPWTLPANKAIAVNADMEYCLVEIENDDRHERSQIVIAKERLEYVQSHLSPGASLRTVIDTIPGLDLADGTAACYNIFSGQSSSILSADFVTANSGTGVVHMAPGHGMEDYLVCQASGIMEAFAPVDDSGKYTADAFPADKHGMMLKGLDVQTEGVKAVLGLLSSPGQYLPPELKQGAGSLLLADHDFTHKNPIDWRTKQPVIVRATAQWFADVSAIRDRTLSALECVDFIPESGRTRLEAFLQGRSQWCISRQRAWGVPIPALYHRETGEACITPESIEHIMTTVGERGTDAWFSDPADDPAWLHAGLDRNEWVRGKDTMDVWFDSGTTWTSLEPRESKPLSDVCVEGTDQHRGWFQSSLLTAIATQDEGMQAVAPYGALVTHGFILDGEGRKMSKSLGNVIAPEEILSGSLTNAKPTKASKPNGNTRAPLHSTAPPKRKENLGPDLLRLWVASSDYTRDVPLSQPALQAVQQSLQKLRVTMKFLLGVLNDYPSPEPMLALIAEPTTFADQVILHQLAKSSQTIWKHYNDYKFHLAVAEINRFINADLSAFYFEVTKDRLYTALHAERRSTQTVLMFVFQELLQWLGPITPHLVEEVWEHMPLNLKSQPTGTSARSGELEWKGFADITLHPLRKMWTSPLEIGFEGWETQELEQAIQVFRSLSTATKLAQEQARTAGKMRSGLECRVEIHLPEASKLSDVATKCFALWVQQGQLPGLLVVSGTEVIAEKSAEQEVAAAKLQARMDSLEARIRAAKAAGDDQEASKTVPLEPPAPAWQYEQPFDAGDADSPVSAKVIVLPPIGQKCERCWQWNVFEPDEPKEPCTRCQLAIGEFLGIEDEDGKPVQASPTRRRGDAEQDEGAEDGEDGMDEETLEALLEEMESLPDEKMKRRKPGRVRPTVRRRRTRD